MEFHILHLKVRDNVWESTNADAESVRVAFGTERENLKNHQSCLYLA